MNRTITNYRPTTVGGKNRLYNLDIFRIGLALLIYAFHSKIHFQCNYGIFNAFIIMGAIAMTGFFILSGFALYYNYSDKDFSTWDKVKVFYKKRAIGIIPLYYVCAILYILFRNKLSLVDNLLLLPIEALGLQTTLSSLFNYSHNGGTWFISCILLCYAVFPYLMFIAKNITTKSRLLLLLLMAFILLWAPVVQHKFDLARIYDNPFYRILEFSIGILLCQFFKDQVYSRIIFSKLLLCIEVCLLVIGVTVAVKIGIPQDYMLYSYLALPLFSLIIVTLAGLDTITFANSKIIQYMSEISFEFFLAQMFLWPISREIIALLGFDGNLLKIIVSLTVCSLIAVSLHELVQKRLKKILNSKI